MKTHLDTSDLVEDSEHPLNFTALATQTEGYSATDLKDLVARAVHRAAMRVYERERDKDFQVGIAITCEYECSRCRCPANTVSPRFRDRSNRLCTAFPPRRKAAEVRHCLGRHRRFTGNKASPSRDAGMANQVWPYIRSISITVTLWVCFICPQ